VPVLGWPRPLDAGANPIVEPGQGTVHVLCEHSSPVDASVCNPKPKSLRQEEEMLLMYGTTIWRTTGDSVRIRVYTMVVLPIGHADCVHSNQCQVQFAFFAFAEH
jgi:hypothetical protein